MSENYKTIVKVSNPEKVGDGITAYVRYTMSVETNDPFFGEKSFTLQRRFREFHALYEVLVDIYRSSGVHVPHPPPKSVKTSARLKSTNLDPNDNCEHEIRRCSLETYINRICRIPELLYDKNVKDFLTASVTSVKARDGLLKLKGNLSSTFSSLIPDGEVLDKWYELKVAEIISLETNLQKLQAIALDIRTCRNDLCFATKKFTISLEDLVACEPNESLVNAYRALIKLKENAVNLYNKQCLNDVHNLIGITNDYLDELISIKHLLATYTKKCSELKTMGQKIEKFNEKVQRLQGTENQDTTNLQKQIEEQQRIYDFTKKSLDDFYEKMKQNIINFENFRFVDMKEAILKYLKIWHEVQQGHLKLWEEFLPICQAIQ